MPNLYDISNELVAILEEAGDDELAPDLEARWNASSMAFEQKVEGTLQYRQGLLGDAMAIEDEIQRLKAKKDGVLRKADGLRAYVMRAMQQLKCQRVTTRTFNASVCPSPLKVEDFVGDIPEQYRRVKTSVELDKAKVLEDFKAGVELPVGLSVIQNVHLKIT